MEGESGRNELLRGPFALFGVRGSAKLVRDLAKHRRTPMSPPQLIPPTSPGRLSPGTEDSGVGFRTPDMVRSGRGLSLTLNGEGPVAVTTCFRRQISNPVQFFHQGALQAYRISRRLCLRPQPRTTIISLRDERLIYTPHHPVRWPYRRRSTGMPAREKRKQFLRMKILRRKF